MTGGDTNKESGAVKYGDDVPCDSCGRFGAFEFDGAKLCTDCYESNGSCCPEFCGERNSND